MKIRYALSIVCLTILAASIVACATKNPDHDTNPSAPPYVVNPAWTATSNAIVQGAAVAAPINPYAGVTDIAIKIALPLLGALFGGLATAKNKNGVIDTLAAGVVKAGPNAAQSVLDHAGTTDHLPAVAAALNANTGINQTSTGAPKTG